MDLSDYEVPRVLVTCRSRQIDDENDDDENVPLNYYINNDLRIQFGREEFCLVTGLRFGVENREEYDTQANLPFRRRVFPSHLDGQPITGIDIANAIVGPTFAELYDDDVVGLCCLGILQLVLLGAESRRNVPEWLLRIANDRVAWNKYPWGSYVWPTLYSQLRNANVRRWGPLYVDQPTNEDDPTTYSIFGYTWAFKTWILESFRVTAIRYFDRFNRYPRVAAWSKKKGRFLAEMVIPFFEGNIPAARLTPDDNEARSDWWISSKAYFDGFIDQVERVPFDLSRQNIHEIPSDIYRQFVEQKIKLERNKKDVDDIKEEMKKFREEMNARPVRQENTVLIIVGQHYGFSDFSEFRSMQVPSYMGRPNLQTTIETQHDVDGIVDQNIPNRGKRQQLPSKYLVTPFTVQAPTTMVPKQRVSKTINKGKKANLSPLNLRGVFEGYNEKENNIYLDCYMRGYIVPVTFWQELAPHLCMPNMQSLSYGTPNGWLGGEHMNSWMEVLIRRRHLNANWTVAYTSTISVHPKNNQFIILNDPHVIGILDGSTRPYPSWNDVDWVFLPIHVAGNHWVTGVIDLANSHFYVFDSLASEENKKLCDKLRKKKNQGTVTRIKTDDNGVFEMLFIAIGASIRTFLNYLRSVLMIDAAHLMGLYKGHRHDQCGQPFVVQPPVNIRTHNDQQFTQNNQPSFNNPTQQFDNTFNNINHYTSQQYADTTYPSQPYCQTPYPSQPYDQHFANTSQPYTGHYTESSQMYEQYNSQQYDVQHLDDINTNGSNSLVPFEDAIQERDTILMYTHHNRLHVYVSRVELSPLVVAELFRDETNKRENQGKPSCFEDMVSYLKWKIPRQFNTLYYMLPPNYALSGMKQIKNDYHTNVMYDIAKVAGKLQIFVSHTQIDLSTVLIPNDGSLEESFAGVISKETKIKLEEFLSYLHQMQKKKKKIDYYELLGELGTNIQALYYKIPHNGFSVTVKLRNNSDMHVMFDICSAQYKLEIYIDHIGVNFVIHKYIFPNAILAEMMNHVITDYSIENKGIIRQETQNDYTSDQMVEWAEQEHFEYAETKVSCPKIGLSSMLIHNNRSKEESFGVHCCRVWVELSPLVVAELFRDETNKKENQGKPSCAKKLFD
ncbi:phospholipase-like protein [Tanacetum coccineum]